MRIHTNTLNMADVYAAMALAGVSATTLDVKGSRTRDHAYEIKLSGDSPFRQNGGREFAATWDQWGIFLAELYRRDPDMVSPYYVKSSFPEHVSSKDVFEYATGYRFDDLTLAESHRRHNWQPTYNHGSTCACGAVQHWDHLVGGVRNVVRPNVIRQPRSQAKVVTPPALPSDDASWQLWNNDQDREWFERMAQRVAARKS